MPMKPKEMMKLLKQNGFVEVKGEGKGEHRKFKNFETKHQTIVSDHPGDLSKKDEHKILKQAGLI